YEQRLSGAVDEMRVVVANFDGALVQLGQTREDAFAPGQDLSDREALMLNNAETNITRLAFLEDALVRVQNASTFERIIAVPTVADSQVAARAYDDFKPAVPLTVDGLACAGLGFIGGWLIIGILIGLLALPFRLRRRKDAIA
ncbi:MAG: DUF2937 family protein, partial [Planktomarina sp.]